jgi:hypothetical protein
MAEENQTEETDADVAEQAQPEDPNRESVIAALRRERAGYVSRGLDDRAAGVDAELKRLGAGPEEEASAAPRETAVESKPRRTAGRGAKQGE